MQKHLARQLGGFSAFCMVAGSVIGSGVFLVAADIAKVVTHPGYALLVWIVAGMLSLMGALTFAELSATYPEAGGQYIFLRKAFGPRTAFLFGWTITLIVGPGSIAAVAVAFGTLFFPDTLHSNSAFWAASWIILGFTVLNVFGVKKGAGVIDFLTSLKVLILIALTLFAATWFSQSSGAFQKASHLANFSGLTAPSLSAFGVALIAAFWAFDGWANLPNIAGELKNPNRTLPMGMFAGLGIVTLLYLTVNASYFLALSPEQMANTHQVAVDAVSRMFGGPAEKTIQMAIGLSMLGCVAAMVLGGARITYAMAVDRALPEWFGFVSNKTLAPTSALWTQAILSILLVWSGTYDQLYTYVICAAFTFYGLTGLCLPILRKKEPEAPRPYRVPFYPVLPMVYVVFCVAFVLNTFLEKPRESLMGLAIVFLGLPFYNWHHRSLNRRVHKSALADASQVT